MALNLKVGQVWQTKHGNHVKLDAVVPGNAFPYLGDNGETYNEKGCVWDFSPHPQDLIELIEDVAAPSAELPVQFADPDPADADALASETLTALGYRFDGQCWVQDAEPKALDVQEGGSHYKSLAIQPVEYIQANGLDYFQGNVVKYITRHLAKNGAEDVKKAIHYCQLILQLQYERGAK